MLMCESSILLRPTKPQHSSEPPPPLAAAKPPNIDEMDTSAAGPLLEDFVAFLNESWTAYHATAEARRRLLEAGFEELDETQPTHAVKVSALQA